MQGRGHALSGAIRKQRLLVLGRGALALAVVRELQQRTHAYEVVDVAQDVTLPDRDLKRWVEEQRVERVVVAAPEDQSPLPLTDLLDCWIEGVSIERVEDFYERLTGRVPIAHLTPANLIFGRRVAPSERPGPLTDLLNIAIALLGFLLSWPLFALAALAIKLESGGPVFFVQRRIGLGGKPFRLVKFRTMDGERTGSEWVKDNRHRITRVGRWLRKFRLDELPQLWNILRCEMNLVGPRPHPVVNEVPLVSMASHMAECGAEIPYYALRTRVRPGLTGWAQVRYGYANDLSEEMEKLTYDLYYVKHRTVWLDLRILLETVPIVLGWRKSEVTESHGTREARAARKISSSPPLARECS